MLKVGAKNPEQGNPGGMAIHSGVQVAEGPAAERRAWLHRGVSDAVEDKISDDCPWASDDVFVYYAVGCWDLVSVSVCVLH